MFLVRAQDEIVDRIERRIARFSKIPAENGESLQILHYGASLHSSIIMSRIKVCPSDRGLHTQEHMANCSPIPRLQSCQALEQPQNLC